jgi:RNase P subunit RPR2
MSSKDKKCECGADVPDYMQEINIDKCYKCQNVIWQEQNRINYEKKKHLLFQTCPECGTIHTAMTWTCRNCGYSKEE